MLLILVFLFFPINFFIIKHLKHYGLEKKKEKEKKDNINESNRSLLIMIVFLKK